MGLIADVPNTVNSNTVIETNTVSNTRIYDNIPVHSQEIVCTEGSGSSLWNETGSLDMSIYRIFSMQDDMKTISYPDRIKNEFDLFIQYGDKKTKGELVTSEFNEFDAFLGKIGVEDGYVC